MRATTVLSLAASVSSAVAQYKGFNYGSTFTDGSSKVLSDFENEFNAAKDLVGTSGFTSARLYTMIQGGTSDTVISAIPAAISTKTTLLLGLWASAGQADLTSEITALTNAITQYGSDFADLVVGISVGSEDLYRITPTGIAAKSGAGAEPAELVSYISQVRSAIEGTVLSSAPVGHVDTWTAWVNGSNVDVIDACDFLGMDAYPYYQNTMSNAISSGAALFASAYEQTVAASAGKSVWVTETGWPVSGDAENLAIPSLDNAKTYWDAVGCDTLFGKVNTWWYTLQDAYPTTPSPSFGVVGTTLSSTPLYNLTCPAGSSGASSSSSSSAVSSATSKTSAVSAATQPTTVPTSATTSILESPVPGPSLGASSSVSASGSAIVSSATGASATKASATATGASATAKSGTTTAVVTTASSESVSGGQTLTIYHTTLITITSCSSVCQTTLSTASATVPATSVFKSSVVSSATSSSATASASSCPADIAGDYQYPHLIVPVSSSSPDKAYGTQYNGTVSSTVSTIFNFDIPSSYAGKTCSLVFLFPELSQLETSSYSFNNEGGIISHVLASAATTSTTYANQPAQVLENGEISSLKSGNSYVISSDSCPGGTTVSFELSATGGLDLEFFEDYNPSPLGLYVRAC